MSLSVVSPAANQEKQSVTGVAVTAKGHNGNYSPQYVPSVARTVKFHSSPVRVRPVYCSGCYNAVRTNR